LGVVDHPPNSAAAHFEDFSSYDEGGVHFAFGDGRVRFINESINETLYQALATPHGDEAIGGTLD
jgi:hypothetical protein